MPSNISASKARGNTTGEEMERKIRFLIVRSIGCDFNLFP